MEFPWERPWQDRPTKKFPLLLTTWFGNAIAVNTWSTNTWKPALAKAGLIPQRPVGVKPRQWAASPKDGFYVLRDTCASILLEAGGSVVTLAQWLGHSSSMITLGYCAHFMPEAGSWGRTAIDGMFGGAGEPGAGRNSPGSPQG
ncbi:hypothetical protein [Streptomyces sp. NPDC048644]|uniref:hypothetical protein n=1 Tax=Streptomyces sp. NPDC048644 TaxID=3365582 RepID=UPI003712BDE8